jgi:regulator of sigma E protease
VHPDSIAQQAGLQVNDQITRIGQERVVTWNDVNLALLSHLGNKSPLSIGVQNTVSHVNSNHTLNLKEWHVDPLHPKPLRSLGIHPFQPKVPPIVGKVFLNSPATLAGLQAGDQILQIDGQPIESWQQMRTVVDFYGYHKLNLLVLRQHQKIHIMITPKQTNDGKKGAYLGIESSLTEFPAQYLRLERYSLLEAWQPAVKKSWMMIHLTFDLLIKIVSGDVSIKTMSGPIGIAQGAGVSASYGISTFLDFLALMSISLGVLNILPIPILDGGHLLFYLIELIRGKPVSLRTRQISMQIGLILLFALVFFAFYNDFNRILS